MGTRHLIAVAIGGKYKVAQYGQWDGGPDTVGYNVLEFLTKLGPHRKDFERKVKSASFVTAKESIGIDAEIAAYSGEWKTKWPEFSRDTSDEILQLILDRPDGIKLKDELQFAADGLFCEWAYVIDLDYNTFEVYKGFNESKLKKTERFAKLKTDKGSKYTPVKHLKTYSLDTLPDSDQFIKDCDPPDF